MAQTKNTKTLRDHEEDSEKTAEYFDSSKISNEASSAVLGPICGECASNGRGTANESGFRTVGPKILPLTAARWNIFFCWASVVCKFS